MSTRHRSRAALLATLGPLLMAGCGDIALVEMQVSTTTKTFLIDVGYAVSGALDQMVQEGQIPSRDPADWPEGIELEFTEDEPLEATPPSVILDLENAQKGGDEFKKYRDKIRTVVIDSLAFSIRGNTLNYDLKEVTLLAGEEELTDEQLSEIVSEKDGIPAGYVTPDEGYDEVPLDEHQKNIIGSFLELNRSRVGLRGRWWGTLDSSSALPVGDIRVKVKVTASVTANPL